MIQKEFICPGIKIKTTGHHGDLLLFFEEGYGQLLQDADYVFFDFPGDPVPFRVKALSISGNSARISLKDITTPEQAAELAQCRLLLAVESGSDQPSVDEFSDISGYKVVDMEKGPIGQVVSVTDLGSHQVMEVEFTGKIILIPVADEIIKKVDRKRKTITIDAPEGLIDLYT